MINHYQLNTGIVPFHMLQPNTGAALEPSAVKSGTPVDQAVVPGEPVKLETEVVTAEPLESVEPSAVKSGTPVDQALLENAEPLEPVKPNATTSAVFPNFNVEYDVNIDDLDNFLSQDFDKYDA